MAAVDAGVHAMSPAARAVVGERTAAAFAERLRDQIDLAGLEADLALTLEGTLHPSSTGVWIRGASR